MNKTQTNLRLHERFDLSCKVEVLDETGRMLTEGYTLNLSDGGMLLVVPADLAPAPGSVISLNVYLPATPSSDDIHMFTSRATIVRHQDIGKACQQGVAIQFAHPLSLDLEHHYGHLNA